MSEAAAGESTTVSSTTRGRRVTVTSAVALVVVAVLGGGAFAAYSMLAGGGPRPESVLPDSTIAVVSVDLDPSAGQKIEAIKSIRRFPALKESLGLDADDDLREWVFDEITAEADCTSLDFEDDVLPWLGKRAGFAAVDLGEDEPAPALLLQVSDQDTARTGFDALIECADPGDDFAYEIGEDYLIASDSAAHAREIRERGEKAPLSDDSAYQKWIGEAGDAGVVSFYVAKRASEYVGLLLDEFLGAAGEGFAEGFSEDFTAGTAAPTADGEEDPLTEVEDTLADFRGLAGTIRFADGGMELSVAVGGLDRGTPVRVGRRIEDLPGDSALVLGFGVGPDYVADYVDQLSGILGEDIVTEMEQDTGLEVPEDLQALLGEALTLSIGGKAPTSLEAIEGPDDLPVGLLIHGDPDEVEGALEKVEAGLGIDLADLPLLVESGSGKVALSPSDYGEELLRKGDLGSSEQFRSAVPDAERASSVVYVDFDSQWIDLLVDLIGEEEGSGAGDAARENLDPLESFGISSWTEDGVSHGLVRVSTD